MQEFVLLVSRFVIIGGLWGKYWFLSPYVHMSLILIPLLAGQTGQEGRDSFDVGYILKKLCGTM
jgi:hypothetical protein